MSLPGVAPSLPRKPLSPSGSCASSQPPGPPRRAINQPEPSVSPALPPAEPHPSSPSRCRLPPAPGTGTVTHTRDAPGDPRHSPAHYGPPGQPCANSQSHNHQRHPGSSWWPAHGSSWGARPEADLGNHHHPTPARCCLPAEGPPVSPCCPLSPVPGAQGEERPSLSLGKQTPIKAFGDYSQSELEFVRSQGA